MNEELKQHYLAVLEQAERERAELDTFIAMCRKKLNMPIESTPLNKPWAPVFGSDEEDEPKQESLDSDSFLGLTIPDAAKKYLAMIKKKQTAAQISQALISGGVDSTKTTITSILAREDGKMDSTVVRVGRGEYGLTEWYGPNFKEKRAEKERKREQDVEDRAGEIAEEMIKDHADEQDPRIQEYA